jgi:hypothetical protein
MDQLKITYKELLSLVIEQPFYKNKVCRAFDTTPLLDFSIQPTEETITLLQQMDLVMKKNEFKGGISVFAHVLGQNAGGNDLLRYKVKPGSKFVFTVTAQNTGLTSYNDIPSIPADDVLYFNNNITDAAAPRTDLHLTLDAAGVKAPDLIKRSGPAYSFHHSSAVLPGTAKVKHVVSGREIEPRSIVNAAGQSDISFDLSVFPSGQCELWINATKEDSFYYLSNSPQNLFAIVELFLSATLPANYRIIEADNSIPAQAAFYKMRLINRPTLWRYNIHLQPNSPLLLEVMSLPAAERADFVNLMSIVTNDATLGFTKLSASESDFVFVSDRLVSLQEKYFSASAVTAPLSLTLEKHVHGQLRPTTLPYPSPASINTTNPASVYSDIFITL